MSTNHEAAGVIARAARETDVAAIADMIDDFSRGHPAASHVRSPAKLREAYFDAAPVAHLVVAERDGHVVGMAQWTKIYEMFWSATRMAESREPLS